MAKESRHTQILDALADRFASMAAGASCWYPPDEVVVVGDVLQSKPLAAYFDESLGTVYVVLPYVEPVEEGASQQLQFHPDVYVFAGRKYQAPETPYKDLETIVAEAALANGALTVAAQPTLPGPLRVRMTDADGSVTAGTLTLVGTDVEDAALTVAVDLTAGKTQLARGTGGTDGGRVFKTLTSATVSGLVGATAADTIKVESRVERTRIQDRLARDVVLRVAERVQIRGTVPQVENIHIVDIDRSMPLDGWAVVQVLLSIDYMAPRDTP